MASIKVAVATAPLKMCKYRHLKKILKDKQIQVSLHVRLIGNVKPASEQIKQDFLETIQLLHYALIF